MSRHEGGVSHTTFFGVTGFIVEPALDELVCIAWNCDLGSPDRQEELRLFVAEHGGKRRPPHMLLRETAAYHNEMIIRGHPGTGIRGIVYVEGLGERDAEKYYYIAEKATGKNIPVIKLPKECEAYEGPDAKEKAKVGAMLEMGKMRQADRDFMKGNILGGNCGIFEKIKKIMHGMGRRA
jgi:hypothetical protein